MAVPVQVDQSQTSRIPMRADSAWDRPVTEDGTGWQSEGQLRPGFFLRRPFEDGILHVAVPFDTGDQFAQTISVKVKETDVAQVISDLSPRVNRFAIDLQAADQIFILNPSRAVKVPSAEHAAP